MSGPVQRFPTTQWSVVVAAQGRETPDARRALERLFETYWFPVYAFIRSRTRSAADAEDFTQGFLLSLLERGSLDSVNPEAGRFRAFLLASAKHYLSVEWERERAQKRGGGVVPMPLDFASADRRYRLEACADSNPEAQFERQWARAAFESAEEQLRHEFAEAGKAVHFEAFRQYFSVDGEPSSYAEVAAALEMTEGAVKVAVHRARRRFGAVLREQVAETIDLSCCATDEWVRAVDDEMSYLWRLLAG